VGAAKSIVTSIREQKIEENAAGGETIPAAGMIKLLVVMTWF